ncbi:MAG: DUF3418 domain-containing protein, partial [Acidimicrobiia bacterium]|nr:DUF3418 domain-containing protein [Acidimicrobiia bacterium]
DEYGALAIVGSPYENKTEWMDDCMNCAVDAVLAASGGVVWDATAFAELIDFTRAELAATIEAVGADAAAVLAALQRVNAAIEDVAVEVFGDVVDDVERQIDRFVFPEFLAAVGAARLDDVRRYLEAAALRLRKLPENPGRDRRMMETILELETEHDRLAEVLSWSPELVDVAWMLQELRVSLFAQSVGAKGPISEKRVRTALRRLLS